MTSTHEVLPSKVFLIRKMFEAIAALHKSGRSSGNISSSTVTFLEDDVKLPLSSKCESSVLLDLLDATYIMMEMMDIFPMMEVVILVEKLYKSARDNNSDYPSANDFSEALRGY